MDGKYHSYNAPAINVPIFGLLGTRGYPQQKVQHQVRRVVVRCCDDRDIEPRAALQRAARRARSSARAEEQQNSQSSNRLQRDVPKYYQLVFPSGSERSSSKFKFLRIRY